VTVIETQGETVTEPAEPPPADTEDSAPAKGGKIRVPNVVGKDHQLAQDTMQAAGLYNLSEEDATGQDRLLLWDRNWTVVSQDPPAGTLVSEDQTIILRSKKDDE
jgi:beta-lactam-binding protein with PASTA domain